MVPSKDTLLRNGINDYGLKITPIEGATSFRASVIFLQAIRTAKNAKSMGFIVNP